MRQVRLILTSVGGLVSPGMIECLRKADGTVYIVGVDAQPDAIGFHFANKSYVVPGGNSPDYVPRLLEIAREENAGVIVPCSDEELLALSRAKSDFRGSSIAVACSDYEIVTRAIDKGSMLEFLREKGIPAPGFYLPQNINELRDGAVALGYPAKPVVVKPRFARGGRGFRIITEQIDLFGGRESYFIRLNHMIDIMKDYPDFPSIVLMEYLPGEEFSVDALADKGEPLYIVPRKRIKAIGGPSQIGAIVPNEEVKAMVQKIIRAFGFDFNVNIQLKYASQPRGLPLVYEINPRVSGTIVANDAAGVNLLYFGIRKALGLDIPVHQLIKEVKMFRYLKEYFIYGDSEFNA